MSAPTQRLDLRLLPVEEPRGLWGIKETGVGTALAALALFCPWWLVVSTDGTWTNKQALAGAGLVVWLALYHGGTLIIAALLGPDRRRLPLASLGFREVSWGALAGYAGAALGAMAVLYWGYSFVAEQVGALPAPREDIPVVYAYERHRYAFILIAAALRPFAEETFFRGFLMQGLTARLGVIGAGVAASVFFALTHLGGGVGLAIAAFGMGLALAWAFHRSGSLWPGILANLVFNSLTLSSRVG